MGLSYGAGTDRSAAATPGTASSGARLTSGQTVQPVAGGYIDSVPVHRGGAFEKLPHVGESGSLYRGAVAIGNVRLPFGPIAAPTGAELSFDEEREASSTPRSLAT